MRKIKNFIILTLAITLLLTLTACGGGNNVATQEGIQGRWTHVKTTIGDEGELVALHDFEETGPTLEIVGNRFIFTTFWGSTIEAIVTETSENHYDVTDIVTRAEEHIWHSDETNFIIYDPETGLLRYTNNSDIIETHNYFTRGGN